MSGSQVVLVVVVVAAFALGWWGHGWRRRGRADAEAGAPDGAPTPSPAPPLPATPSPAPPSPATPSPAPAELDAFLRDVLTAFQAALGLWQAQGPGSASPRPATARALAAFERCHGHLDALDLDGDASPAARAALRRARRAADRLADGLAPLATGVPLERERERALIGAERALTAARQELLGPQRAAGSSSGS